MRAIYRCLADRESPVFDATLANGTVGLTFVRRGRGVFRTPVPVPTANHDLLSIVRVKQT